VTLPLLWLAYLWLSNAGGEFLAFQWDALLLETGLLSMVLARFTIRERVRDAIDPPRLAVWLMLWLLFRLMLGSGAVKLASGDPTWRDLTALSFHYETQPIPNPVAFYFHHLPPAFNKASTAVSLAIELIAPFLIFGSTPMRVVAAGLFVGLQALIALTGNFAFFNLLAASLCVFLIDDEAWMSVAQAVRRGFKIVGVGADLRVRPGADTLVGPYHPHLNAGLRPAVHLAHRIFVGIVAVVVVPVSLLTFTSSLGFLLPGWPLVAPIAQLIAPLRSVNSYGLFAVMTTTRPEIVVEGSNDGEIWLAYDFKYKPGDLTRRPPFVAPHQPRLDWQMWFAALSRYDEEAWFHNFCIRLLQGSPDVLRLLERDPFSGRPPRYVRATLYQYHFADLAAHRANGAWWTRERRGEYSPALSLRAPTP